MKHKELIRGDKVQATRRIVSKTGIAVVNPGDVVEVLSVFNSGTGNQVVSLSSACGKYSLSDVVVMRNDPCVVKSQ